MPERTLTVSELNEYVAGVLYADPIVNNLRVDGEISGFKRHTSGHLYFSLKDEHAVVRCVMFRPQALRLRFQPKDGMQVTLIGRASLYERDGSFQLYAQMLEKHGDGDLLRRFLEMKEALDEAGYFDPARKRKIPYLPKAVGVVTSDTGAALQDILRVIGRRFPRMPIVLAPARVQGEGAAEEIASAIQRLNASDLVDVMIVGRGGGSIEDLWAFNEPVVAETIHQCRVPVISAVGHETDFSISDFVADLRAPTPSAAAELAVPEYDACLETLRGLSERLHRAAENGLRSRRDALKILTRSASLYAPERRIANERITLDALTDRLRRVAEESTASARQRLTLASHRLSAFDPKSVLRRGFTMLTDTDGRVLSSAHALSPGETVFLHFADGTAEAAIRSIISLEDTHETTGTNV